MRHARAAAVLATALLAGCGRPLLSTRLEVPEARFTEPGQQFAPPFASTVDPCSALPPGCRATVTSSVRFDIGAEVPLLDEDGVDLDLRLTQAGLHFDSGSSAGLQQVLIRLTNIGGSILLASYDRPPGAAAPTDVVLSTNSDVNLAPYLHGGVIIFPVELVYDGDAGEGVPSGGGPVSVDVTLAFSIDATADYTKM